MKKSWLVCIIRGCQRPESIAVTASCNAKSKLVVGAAVENKRSGSQGVSKAAIRSIAEVFQCTSWVADRDEFGIQQKQ